MNSGMRGSWTDVPVSGGHCRAFVVAPAADRFPASVLVLHDIFGVDHVTRDFACNLAEFGFSVCCPDLYWRHAPGSQLTQAYVDFREALRLQDRFEVPRGVEDAHSVLSYLLARQPGSAGLVVGFGLGGLLAVLLSGLDGVRGCVSYYGTGVVECREAIGAGRNPLLFHVGSSDYVVDAGKQQRIGEMLGANPLVELRIYPGVGHRFVSSDSATYDPAAAELANARTAEFLARMCAPERSIPV
jgi:carboxymethylenebutenolidase